MNLLLGWHLDVLGTLLMITLLDHSCHVSGDVARVEPAVDPIHGGMSLQLTLSLTSFLSDMCSDDVFGIRS